MTRLLIRLACVGVVTGLGPSALLAADIGHGKTLAERWCASCHLVAPEQRQASTDATPFATVAQDPYFDAARLAYFLLEPHPKMPNMALTRVEAADLAAFIGSLAKK